MMPARLARPVPPTAPSRRRTIPYDYAFRFALLGQAGRVVNQPVTVSVEAPFVAVSIGYGVVAEPLRLELPRPQSSGEIILLAVAAPAPNSLRALLGGLLPWLESALGEDAESNGALPGCQFGPRTAAVLRQGVRVNPTVAERALLTDGNLALSDNIISQFFQAVTPPPGQVQFKYALFDEGTGREFQSEPILNTAGLGTPDGDRPFRYLARPILFAPRTTIRMEVTEVSEFVGDLHVALHGYKVLGAPGTPTAAATPPPTGRRRR